MTVSGGSSGGSINFKYTTMTDNSSQTTTTDDGSNPMFMASGSASEQLNGNLTGPGALAMPLNWSVGDSFSMIVRNGVSMSSGDTSDMPGSFGVDPQGVGAQNPVTRPGGAPNWWASKRQPGQGAVVLLPTNTGDPGLDAEYTYYNWLAKQWNSGQITWPFAGNPPGAGNITPGLPGQWMIAPAAPEAPIPPYAFGNWTWANSYFYSGTVITPYEQTGPPGHAGVVVAIYRVGVLTWWKDIQTR